MTNVNGFNILINKYNGFSEKRLPLKLEYKQYGPVITSDRLIQLLAITSNKQAMNYQKAEKTIVLDEPHIKVEVWTMDR